MATKNMTSNVLDITLIIDSTDSALPDDAFFHECLQSAWSLLSQEKKEITVKLIDPTAMTELNREFFGKDKPTNVLSFPFEALPGLESDELGDIAICMAVVREESERFQVEFKDRLAHMLIHALLHLMGHDHIHTEERETMEALEQELLQRQGFGHPYEVTTRH